MARKHMLTEPMQIIPIKTYRCNPNFSWAAKLDRCHSFSLSLCLVSRRCFGNLHATCVGPRGDAWEQPRSPARTGFQQQTWDLGRSWLSSLPNPKTLPLLPNTWWKTMLLRGAGSSWRKAGFPRQRGRPRPPHGGHRGLLRGRRAAPWVRAPGLFAAGEGCRAQSRPSASAARLTNARCVPGPGVQWQPGPGRRQQRRCREPALGAGGGTAVPRVAAVGPSALALPLRRRSGQRRRGLGTWSWPGWAPVSGRRKPAGTLSVRSLPCFCQQVNGMAGSERPGAWRPGRWGGRGGGTGGLRAVGRRPEAPPAMDRPVRCQSRLGNVLHQDRRSDFAAPSVPANVANCYAGVREMSTEERFKVSKVHLQMAKVSTWLIPVKTMGVWRWYWRPTFGGKLVWCLSASKNIKNLTKGV